MWTEFYAVCSPVKDDTVVFEASLFKDGHLIYDHYMDETSLMERLNEKISKVLEDNGDKA